MADLFSVLESQATLKSNSFVNLLLWKAQGTAAVTTPCSGHEIRGIVLLMSIRTPPQSSPLQLCGCVGVSYFLNFAKFV